MERHATKGKEFYPDLILPLAVSNKENIEEMVADRFRILFAADGNGLISLNGERMFLISPRLIILNENDRLQVLENHNLSFRTLYFTPDLVNSGFSFESIRSENPASSFTAGQDFYFVVPFLRENVKERIFSMNVNTLQRVKKLYKQTEDELEKQETDCWPCSVRCYLFELLHIITRLSPEPAADTATMKPVADNDINSIILFIHTNLSEKLTVNDLARQFHTNRTTISERFKEETGKTIIAYISSLRIKMAAAMLHSTDLPISDIQFRVGFEDKSHFGRLFKRELGLPPGEYRKQYCWMEDAVHF